jgi:class 3 adenylate cyclase
MIRQVLLTITIFIVIAEVSQAQVFSLNDSINSYHSLTDQREYEQAAYTAMRIADQQMQQQELGMARKFYDYAFMSSSKTKNRLLEARALFKLAKSEKQMAESGKYSLTEEQEYYADAALHFMGAHINFTKTTMVETYEHTMALMQGAEIQYQQGEYKDAVKGLTIAFKIAQKQRQNDLALKASKLLASSYGELNDRTNQKYFESVYQNYDDYFISKDSLSQQTQTIEKLETARKLTESELELKQSEIERKNLELENQKAIAEANEAIIRQQQLERRLMIGGIAVVLLFLLMAGIAYRFARKANKKLKLQNSQISAQKTEIEKRQEELRKEKNKSDHLLLNILPKPVAEELKDKGKVQPRYYPMVSVVFTDFKGFTHLAAGMTPGEIVRELEVCFYAFDNIIDKYNLEKIKTIGDGYMCAGGVPVANKTNPLDAVKAALEMTQFIEQRKQEKLLKNEPFFEVRIGINTGPVVAGVVGKNKFAYDIWGDAVNLASRMESSGEVGRVNISGETYRYVKDHFFFTYRGRVSAKKKGEVEMYFVDGRVRYSQQGAGLPEPNAQ